MKPNYDKLTLHNIEKLVAYLAASEYEEAFNVINFSLPLSERSSLYEMHLDNWGILSNIDTQLKQIKL